MLNAAWQDLKKHWAIGIYEQDGVLNVHFAKMNDLKNCKKTENYKSKDYDQYYKMVNGVKYFALIKKEVL